MRRSALLTVSLLVVVLFAGCTSAIGPAGTGSPDGTPDATPTETPDVTPMPNETCEAVDQQTADPYREDVEPSEFPDPPATWNDSSVEAYVTAFEESYSRNAALSEISTRVSTHVSDVSVTETDRGWEVSLTSRTNTWAAGTDTAEGTPTVVHGDGARIPVTYHVTDEGLYRLESDYGETPDPDALGTPVACFE